MSFGNKLQFGLSYFSSGGSGGSSIDPIDLSDWENRPTDVAEGTWGAAITGALYRFQADAQEWVRNEVYSRVVDQEGQTFKATYGFTGAESSVPTGWVESISGGSITYNTGSTPPYIEVSSSNTTSARLIETIYNSENPPPGSSYVCGYIWVDSVTVRDANLILGGRSVGGTTYIWGFDTDGSPTFEASTNVNASRGESYETISSGSWHWFEIYQTEQSGDGEVPSNQFNWFDFQPSLSSAWDDDTNVGGNYELKIGSVQAPGASVTRWRDLTYIEWNR